MDINKYDGFELPYLIKYIQESEIKMLDRNYKKKITTSTMRKRSSELMGMRMSVVTKLKKMDRRLPNFFPIGVHVEYKHPDVLGEPKDAIVMGHRGNYVIIQEEGKTVQMEVETVYLKIKYLRTKY
jgi:hypothetical protein